MLCRALLCCRSCVSSARRPPLTSFPLASSRGAERSNAILSSQGRRGRNRREAHLFTTTHARRQSLTGHTPYVSNPSGGLMPNPAFPSLRLELPVPTSIHHLMLRCAASLLRCSVPDAPPPPCLPPSVHLQAAAAASLCVARFTSWLRQERSADSANWPTAVAGAWRTTRTSAAPPLRSSGRLRPT